MDLRKLAQYVEMASGPDRKLDILLGMQIGYERHSTNGRSQPLEARWKAPNNGDIGTMPAFTASVEAAWGFVMALCPDASQIAVTFDEHGRGNADVDDQRVLQCATPALALCAAALMCRLRGYDEQE